MRVVLHTVLLILAQVSTACGTEVSEPEPSYRCTVDPFGAGTLNINVANGTAPVPGATVFFEDFADCEGSQSALTDDSGFATLDVPYQGVVTVLRPSPHSSGWIVQSLWGAAGGDSLVATVPPREAFSSVQGLVTVDSPYPGADEYWLDAGCGATTAQVGAIAASINLEACSDNEATGYLLAVARMDGRAVAYATATIPNMAEPWSATIEVWETTWTELRLDLGDCDEASRIELGRRPFDAVVGVEASVTAETGSGRYSLPPTYPSVAEVEENGLAFAVPAMFGTVFRVEAQFTLATGRMVLADVLTREAPDHPFCFANYAPGLLTNPRIESEPERDESRPFVSWDTTEYDPGALTSVDLSWEDGSTQYLWTVRTQSHNNAFRWPAVPDEYAQLRPPSAARLSIQIRNYLVRNNFTTFHDLKDVHGLGLLPSDGLVIYTEITVASGLPALPD